jgi:hypothetical protein
VQARLDAGEKPHFLPETRRIRESEWKVTFPCQPVAPHDLARTCHSGDFFVQAAKLLTS